MTKEEVKNKILANKVILDKYKVKSIAIFGSFVRNEQAQNSDIDFLVEFQKPTFDNYIGLRDNLKRLLHRKVDLVSKKALKERIKRYILKEAEWLKIN